MSDQSFPSNSQHVYRLSWWAVALYIAAAALGGAILTLSVIVFGWAANERDWSFFTDWRISPFIVLLGISGAFLLESNLKRALRSRLALDGARVSVCNGSGEKSAWISEIEDYHLTGVKSAFWIIRLRGGGSIAINQWFQVDDAFRSFLAKLKQVDGDGRPISSDSK